MPTPTPKPLTLKGTHIREDANGLLCLGDIYKAARQPKNQSPPQWQRLPTTTRLIVALVEKNMGKSHVSGKISVSSVVYTKRGGDGGTYAHPVLAAAYAAYLSPKLAIEIKEVWLRYKQGDPTLADEILERASDEANRWVAARATGRVERRKFTDALQRAGVRNWGYARCTDAIYKGLWMTDAKNIRKTMELPAKANPRDKMNTFQLSQIALAEGMASERIEEEECQGENECHDAAKISAGYVRRAIEDEKASRSPKKRLL